MIHPPWEVDIIMVAPRMIGVNVRRSFEKGRGVPAYIAVAQDASGQARDIALAWAKGIGATRAGVLETTFAQETELDLFSEQATWPIILRDLFYSYEVLVEAGFPPEMVALELYGSGEASEVFRQMARVGIVNQMQLHSQTSQYGTLSRGPRLLPEETKQKLQEVLAEIRSGDFAKEWTEERQQGYPNFKRLRKEAQEHEINRAEILSREMVDRAGIGEATAELFAEEGATVVLLDNQSGGEEVADRIRAAGGAARFIQTDISQEEEIRKAMEAVEDEQGRVDILINNAAVFVLKGLEATPEDWHRSLDVNIIGTALCTRYASESMKKNKSGSIVNLSSISGFVAQPRFITYSATKAALVGEHDPLHGPRPGTLRHPGQLRLPGHHPQPGNRAPHGANRNDRGAVSRRERAASST